MDIDFSKLNDDDRAEAVSQLKEACYHLCAVWDALGAVERLFGDTHGDDFEIDTLDIQAIAADCDTPGDAYKLTEKQFQECLAEVTR